MKEEKGAQLVCTLLRTQLYLMAVHTTVAALVELTGIFLPPSLYRDVQ
jgi:hypothetical protein